MGHLCFNCEQLVTYPLIMANKPKEKEEVNYNSNDTTHITEKADIVPDVDSIIEDFSKNPVIFWV